jgi:hypothetical protein
MALAGVYSFNEDCTPENGSIWHSPILRSVYIFIALALGE